MFRNIFLFLAIFLMANTFLFALDIEYFFNSVKNNNVDIVYYNGEQEIDMALYSKAYDIKHSNKIKNNEVYSISVADIFDSDGSEIIVIYKEDDVSKIDIYSENSELLYSYSINSDTSSLIGGVLELEEFYNKGSRVNIIKYYRVYESENTRDIYLHIFRVENSEVEHFLDLHFYQEIRSGALGVQVILNSIFVDIDEDDMYEMLIESKSKVMGKEDKINYQVYKYNIRTKKYMNTVSEWDKDEKDYENYSRYFLKR